MIKIGNKQLKLSAYIFLYINIVIFVLGFLKIYVGLPVAAVCGGAIYLNIKNTKDDSFEISKKMLISAVAVLGVIMIAAGHGGLCSQLMDWSARNAILRDLIAKPWPVYYSDGSALSYYLGYFILPGAVGKLIGFKAAYWLMYLYGVYGMLLIYLYLVKLLKAETAKKQLVILLMIFLFANCEDLKNIFTNVWIGIRRLSDSGYSSAGVMIGFTPFFTLYATVFNQIIPAFLVLAMLLSDDTDLGGIAVAAVPLILYSPFQILYIFVIAVIAMVKLVMKNGINSALKHIFTIENIAVLAALTPILILYIWGNISGEKPDVLKFHKLNYKGHFGTYGVFIFTQVLIYGSLLFSRFRKNPYYWAAEAGLIILPLWQWGLYNDLCTRASSVGLFIFMVLIMRLWFETAPGANKARRICCAALAVIIGFSAIKPMSEFTSAVTNGSSNFANGKTGSNLCIPYPSLENVKTSDKVDFKYNFFAFDAEDTLFFGKLARK